MPGLSTTAAGVGDVDLHHESEALAARLHLGGVGNIAHDALHGLVRVGDGDDFGPLADCNVGDIRFIHQYFHVDTFRIGDCHQG